MRLIDADAFDKMLIEAQAKCKKNGGNFRFGVLENIRANLALFPTVDRPEIVRCKDCKHGKREEWDNGEYKGVTIDCCGQTHELDWFCADGVKKDD